jgi:hypothetical protein
MEFLLSLSYLRFEIVFLLANLAFLAVFFVIEIVDRIKRIAAVLFPKGRKSTVVPTEAPKSETKEEAVAETGMESGAEQSSDAAEDVPEEKETDGELSPERKLEIIELVKTIRTKIAR